MFAMLTVAAELTGANLSDKTRIWLYASVASIVANVIALLLVRLADVYALVVALLLMGVGPVLGYAVATQAVGRGRSIVAMILGALASVLGVIVAATTLLRFLPGVNQLIVQVGPILEPFLWPVLVGVTLRTVSVGKCVLWSIIAHFVGFLVVTLLVIPVLGQNPTWVQIAFLVWGTIWGLGVSYALSR